MNLLLAQVINTDKLPKPAADQNTLNTILSIVFVTIGALSVLMLIIAGLRYILAQGEPQKNG